MGFHVRKHRNTWRVIATTYANGGKSEKHVVQEDYARLGVSKTMSIEEARAAVRALNARDRLEKRELRRQNVSKAQAEGALIKSAYLPGALLEEFERELAADGNPKLMPRWNRAKKLIVDTGLDYTQHFAYRAKIYAYLADQQLSAYYARDIIAVMNRWGRFRGRKATNMYEELPVPKSTHLQRIKAAYKQRRGQGNESDPITPAMLESARSRLKPAQYNWLLASVWFGLRPGEVDRLSTSGRDEFWKVVVQQGHQCLMVFQTKLGGIDEDQRWKTIPVITPQQRRVIGMIEDGVPMKRPLVKTIKAHLSDTCTCYGGRKGFYHLMTASYGQEPGAISFWLGHKDLATTAKKYADSRLLTPPRPLKAD